MYILPAFTSINTPKTPLTVIINRKYFFFEQGLSYTFPRLFLLYSFISNFSSFSQLKLQLLINSRRLLQRQGLPFKAMFFVKSWLSFALENIHRYSIQIDVYTGKIIVAYDPAGI